MNTMRWSEPTAPHDDGGPPTIKNHSVTNFRGYLYCFGGYDGRRNHMTLLLYSIRDQVWIPTRQIAAEQDSARRGMVHGSAATVASANIPYRHDRVIVSGSPPPGRNGHTATLATDPDDEEHGRIVIIGGWLGSGPLAASDMHVLDVSPSGLRWYQPNFKGTPPGPCNMHSADFVPSRREVYVFRGGNGREYLNDLHALNVDTYTWRRVETTGSLPQQRANHSSSLLEETGELFIFGGWNGRERLNDIHILDTETSTWTCPHVGGVLPHPRAGMTLTALRGRLFLFGGSGTSSKCFQDLQILDRKEMAWLDVEPQETSRGHRSFHSEDDDEMEVSYEMAAVGGGAVGGGGTHRQLKDDEGGFMHRSADWRTRDRLGSTAAAVASPNPNDEDTVPTVVMHGAGPGRRAGHTATAVNRRLYVFGGSCGSDYLNDFFVLDTDPPPRAAVTEPNSIQLFERRLRHFFYDEEFADVTFIVEGRKVHGHRMVLSIVSDCFRAMFMTGFRESTAGAEIEIPDCSYEAFSGMMEYIYTGRVPLLEEGQINHVVDLLELADQFFLDHLKQKCEMLLQTAVNSETVEYLQQVAQKTNASQLLALCEHFERNRDNQ